MRTTWHSGTGGGAYWRRSASDNSINSGPSSVTVESFAMRLHAPPRPAYAGKNGFNNAAPPYAGLALPDWILRDRQMFGVAKRPICFA